MSLKSFWTELRTPPPFLYLLLLDCFEHLVSAGAQKHLSQWKFPKCEARRGSPKFSTPQRRLELHTSQSDGKLLAGMSLQNSICGFTVLGTK